MHSFVLSHSQIWNIRITSLRHQQLSFLDGILNPTTMGNKSTKQVVSENPQKQPFYRAANNGQASFLDELLGSGNCDFQMASDDETPLHVAVKKKRTKAVEVILKHRCRIYDKLTKAKDERELQRNNTNLVETGY